MSAGVTGKFTMGDVATGLGVVYEQRVLEEPGQACVAQVLTDQHGLYLWQIDLVTGERGRGTGSRLLATLCAEADRRGLKIRLTAVGPDRPATERLVSWYGRQHFRVVSWDMVGGCRMERLPGGGSGG